jgi:hypothetical protein
VGDFYARDSWYPNRSTGNLQKSDVFSKNLGYIRTNSPLRRKFGFGRHWIRDSLASTLETVSANIYIYVRNHQLNGIYPNGADTLTNRRQIQLYTAILAVWRAKYDVQKVI